MRILFVVADLYFSEPLGVMILSGVCKNAGHQTRLGILEKQDIAKVVEEFAPDVIAYSAMTPDEHLFIKADATVSSWAINNKRRVLRVMGGPHPTYFPEILQKMNLDAICAGDGENFCRTSQIAGQATSGACTGPDSCGYANNGQVRCHFKVRLKVQIDGQTDPFSVFELQSGSINTYRTLSAKLNLMHAAFGGKLRHVPLNLTIWNKSSSESTYLPFYCADLKLAENETMATAIKKANDGATADTNAGLAIDAMEASVKEMQAAGALSLDGSDNAVITFTTNHIPGKTTRRSIAAPKGDDISSVIALAKTAATSSVEPDSAPKTSDVEAVSVAPVVRVPAAAMETAVQMTVPSTKEKPPTPL